MSLFMELFCCCFYSKTPEPTINTQRSGRNGKKKKKTVQPKPSRIVSKYKKQETIQISKQQMKKGKMAYTCPICTLFFNKILACNQCQNNMCRNCVQSYEVKFQVSSLNMKCPFCNSQKSNYIDYELQARSYFDTTGKNGFLDPMERKKLDQQMKWNGSKYLDKGNDRSPNNLQSIQEEATVHQFPTQNNISHVSHYHQVIVSRRQILKSQNNNGNSPNNQMARSLNGMENQRFEVSDSIMGINRNRNEQIRQNNNQNVQNIPTNINSDLRYIQQFQLTSPQNQIGRI